MVSLRPLGSKTSLTDEPDTPPRDNKTIFSVVFQLTICSKLAASDGNVEFSAIAEPVRTTSSERSLLVPAIQLNRNGTLVAYPEA